MKPPTCTTHPDCGRRAIRVVDGRPCCLWSPTETPPRLIAHGAVGVAAPVGTRTTGAGALG